MKRFFWLMLIVTAGALAVKYGVESYRVKYADLRKIYNETAIAYIQSQVGKMPKEELDRLRAVVEKSTPKLITETAIDIGVIKDKAGEWKVKS